MSLAKIEIDVEKFYLIQTLVNLSAFPAPPLFLKTDLILIEHNKSVYIDRLTESSRVSDDFSIVFSQWFR